ncbi:hypothetical protein ACJJTC_006624 [Scirpophaga incertulas]
MFHIKFSEQLPQVRKVQHSLYYSSENKIPGHLKREAVVRVGRTWRGCCARSLRTTPVPAKTKSTCSVVGAARGILAASESGGAGLRRPRFSLSQGAPVDAAPAEESFSY